jgi:hypothetical protein
MKVLSTEINIATPPERVWQVLTDFSNYEAWNPFIRRIEGKAEIGEVVKFTIRLPDRKLTLDCLISEMIPNQKICWKWHLFFDRFDCGDHSLILRPHGGNRVHIDHRVIYNRWLLGLAEHLTGNQIKRGFVDMNKALKSYCERVASEQAA